MKLLCVHHDSRCMSVLARSQRSEIVQESASQLRVTLFKRSELFVRGFLLLSSDGFATLTEVRVGIAVEAKELCATHHHVG